MAVQNKLNIDPKIAAKMLQSVGFDINYEALREGLKANAFPFGTAFKMQVNYKYLIYTQKLLEFIKDNGGNLDEMDTGGVDIYGIGL